MLGENHSNRNERDGSLSSNRARRPEIPVEDEFENNDENRHLDSKNAGPSTNADYCRNSTEGSSSAEINRLSSELNSRLSRQLDEMMSSVNTQIQRAISDAINSQILPQLQSALSAGSGHLTQNRWNVPSDRPEAISEVLQNACSRDNARSKPNRDCLHDRPTDLQTYDTMVPHLQPSGQAVVGLKLSFQKDLLKVTKV